MPIDSAEPKPSSRKSKPKAPSRTRKPQDMSLEQWQIALRREFAKQQRYKLKSLGGDAIFGDYSVANPQTRREYRVSIRGSQPGDNRCTCPDFAVNTLGTCKHIEYTLSRVSRLRGARQSMAQGYTPPCSEVYLRYGARRQVAFRAGADCPDALRKLAGRFFPDGVLADRAFASFDDFLREAQATGQEVRCYEDALAFIAQVRDRAALARRIDEALPQGEETPELDRLMKVPLYSYQKKGAIFAARAGRALIADDMGLGKTIQAMAAAELLARHGGVERALVIAPTSLKHQWRQEIERFTGRSAQVVEGLLPARHAAYRSNGTFYKIANYDVIHRDLDAIQAWEPDLIILDEAQRIKNWKTRAAKSVKQLASPYAVVLTGTPLENRLEELHSIIEFVDRFRLGPSFRFLAEHQIMDEAGKVVGYRNLDRIARTLSSLLIRRTKQEVLKELPERIERLLFLPMTPQQAALHAENQEIVARIVAKWRKYGFLTEADQRRLTCALQNMRMSCDSTYLLDPETDFGPKAGEFASLLSETLEEPDVKVVVFSQWLRMHELLVRKLQQQRCDYVLFHGGVPGPKRKDLVARFKEDDRCRVFLATDAGGVGLNLQHASAVFNLDLPWNPAVLEQRIGRVHRLGQRRPVQVVNFVAENSIEHGMLNLLKFKRSVFAGVLDGGESEVFLGASRLKKFMESVEQASGQVPPASPAEPAGEPTPAPTTPIAESSSGESRPAPAAPIAAKQPADVLAGLVDMGRRLLDTLAQATAPQGAPADTAPRALIEHDEKSGQSYLKLPMPSADVLEKVAGLLGTLLGRGA